MKREPVIVVDLDNCVADDGWRRHFIETDRAHRARYHKYHLHALYDKLGNAWIVQRRQDIVICTGRPELYRDLTITWLHKYEIAYVALLMRDNRDYRPAVAMKIEALIDYRCQTDRRIQCAYDDRQDVIDAYRAMGLTAQRVSITEEEVPVGH